MILYIHANLRLWHLERATCISVCCKISPPKLDCWSLEMDYRIAISFTIILNPSVIVLSIQLPVFNLRNLVFRLLSNLGIDIYISFPIVLFLTSESLSFAGRCYTFQLRNSWEFNVLMTPILFQVINEEVKLEQIRFYLKFQGDPLEKLLP